MSKTNTLENEWLEHLLNNAAITLVGDSAGLLPSAADGDLYFSLHTGDPTETGDQEENEIAYTSYARVAIARTGSAWTVTVNSAVPASVPIAFPTGTGGSGTATHWGLGTAVSGAGKLLYKGAISPTIVCGDGVTPRINPTVTED